MGIRFGGGRDAIRNAGYMLGWLSDLFYYIANTIRNVPILGNHLASPFSWAGDYFKDAENNVLSFAEYYGDVVATASQALPAASLLPSILTMFREWNEFRSNPVEWVKKKVSELLKDGDKFFENWFKWYLDRLKDYSKELRNFFEKPYEQIEKWIKTYNPLVGEIFSSPRNGFLSIIGLISKESREFIENPMGFLRERIIRLFGFPLAFWDDVFLNLFRWGMDEYRKRYSLFLGEVYSEITKVARYFWEGKYKP